MDEIWIQKVLHGDSEAFRQIISKYKDMAYSIAMSVIKDEFYTEEILQEMLGLSKAEVAALKEQGVL